MKIRIPQTSIGKAGAQQVQVGEVKLGPAQIGQLTLNQVHMAVSTGKALLRGVQVSLGLKFSLEWKISLVVDGIDLLPSWIDHGGTIDLGAMALNIPLDDIPLQGLDLLEFDIPSLQAKDLKPVVGAIKNLKLGALLAERIQAQGLVAPGAGFQLGGLGVGSVEAGNIRLPDAQLAKASIGRVSGGGAPLAELNIGGLALPKTALQPLSVTDIRGRPRKTVQKLPPAGGPLLTATLTVTVDAGMRIEELRLDNLKAAATVGAITLKNVSLPYEVLDLSLAQVGIEDIQVPQLQAN